MTKYFSLWVKTLVLLMFVCSCDEWKKNTQHTLSCEIWYIAISQQCILFLLTCIVFRWKKIAFEVRKYMQPLILRGEIRGSYLSRETGEPSRTPRTSRHYNLINKSKREGLHPKIILLTFFSHFHKSFL